MVNIPTLACALGMQLSSSAFIVCWYRATHAARKHHAGRITVPDFVLLYSRAGNASSEESPF
jgi:hypothetical protein